MKTMKPTLEQFRKYQAAYDYFNKTLFESKLKPCLLVFREGKKRTGLITLGHFAPHRWTKGEEHCHEISLNPDTLLRDFEDTMSTLVHEMVHQWQQDHATPPRGGYHDRQWAKKMGEVGLIASDTGEPGGKQTGQRMTHYIERGGPFAAAFKKMPDSVRLPWATGVAFQISKEKPEKEEKPRNKLKYTCPGCESNVWGKSGLSIICGECDQQFEEQE
jgi:hypothetical protein